MLVSHTIGVLTDISVMAYLNAMNPKLMMLLYVLIANGIVILITNLLTMIRYRRCAGVNYFDTLSANLVLVIGLQQLFKIRVSQLVLGAATMAAVFSLALSAGFAIAFNLRIRREEDTED